mgnify:CR=1 FL=1
MKRNLITGGLGFIGSHLIERLIYLGEYVVCLDNFSSGNKGNLAKWNKNPNFKFIYGDILDKHEIKFDKLWHLACPASPKEYLKDPILTARINFEGTLNLLNLAKDQKAKMVFTSTSEVYGNCDQIPQVENFLGFVNTKNLRSCYAHGKRIAETLCFDFQRKYKMEIKIARIFNTYGPGLRPEDGRVISNFINQALNNVPLSVFGDGKQTRSFCYVEDIIDALLLLMNSNFKDPINLGNSNEISIIDLAKLIDNKIYANKQFSFMKSTNDEISRRSPSLKLVKEVLNWQPRVDLSDGLDLTIEFEKKKLKKLQP